MMYLFLRKFKEQEKGMFTLEASLIFPIIFISTIALILVSLIIYNQLVVYQRAHIIAERVAFSWDNSAKDLKTGSFGENEYTTMPGGDGLYWRVGQIGSSFINKLGGTTETAATSRKISKANTESSAMLPSAVVVVEQPDFGTLNPQVSVTITSDFRVPEILANFISTDKYEVTAYASVKDPVEIIRTTDMVIEYGTRIFNSVSGD